MAGRVAEGKVWWSWGLNARRQGQCAEPMPEQLAVAQAVRGPAHLRRLGDDAPQLASRQHAQGARGAADREVAPVGREGQRVRGRTDADLGLGVVGCSL